MFNKLILGILFICLTGVNTIVIAKSINEMNPFEKAYYFGQINYYHRVKNCQKGTFKLPTINMMGTDLEMVLYVLGKKDNKCNIREHLGNSDIRCQLPMDVAEKYGDEGIKTLNESVKNGSSYSKYINQIKNDATYCQQY